MSGQLLLTFNAGSSSVKIGLFSLTDGGGLPRVGKGIIDFRNTPLRFELSEGPDRFDVELEASAWEELDEVLSEAFSRLSCHYRSEEHTSELQSLMRNSYAGFC